MYSVVARLKVLGVSVSGDETEDDDMETGLRIYAKTKWAPNVLVPLQRTLALPTYTFSANEELVLFLEVWDKDSKWGMDKLLGLAQFDLKGNLLRDPAVQPHGKVKMFFFSLL